MSTQKLTLIDLATTLVVRRLLIPWRNRDGELIGRRCLLLTHEAHTVLDGLKGDPRWEQWSESIAAFTAAELPLFQQFESAAHRGLVSKMNILGPKPGLRLLGGFADNETFICTAAYPRDELAWKWAPGAGRSWRDANDEALRRFRELMDGMDPVSWKDVIDDEE